MPDRPFAEVPERLALIIRALRTLAACRGERFPGASCPMAALPNGFGSEADIHSFTGTMLHMTPVELASILKDAVLAGAACATVAVAFFGLSTWNRQLRGQADFEAARSLAKALYRLRDEVQIARSALVRGHEFPPGYFDGPRSAKPPSDEAEAWAHVYAERLRPVGDAVREFDTATLEAEALWGQIVRDRAREVHACLRTLRSGMEAVIDNARSGGEDFKADREFGKQVRADISARSDGSDPLSQRIRDAIEAMETIIRPHLRRQR